jgi:iron(III)-enterobactin esterase
VKSSLAPSALTRLAVTFGLASLGLLSACASSDPITNTPQGGSGPGSGGQPAGGTTSLPTAGAAAQTAGAATAGSATAGTDAGGSSSAGTGGAAGSASGGTAGSATAGAPGLPEVSAEGDGDVIVGPSYTNEKELSDQGNPKGKSFSFNMQLADSKLFDGKDPTLTKAASTTRSINVYVPAKYQDGTPAALLVIQDGPGELNQVSRALDNLTIETDPMRKLPPFIAVAVQNGGNDSIGSERGLEYDTVSDKYARFIDTEVLPAVINDAKIKAAYPGLKFTTDPSGRATMGCSSGGAAAFTMAWLRPDLFSRVIGYSATLVAQQDPKAPESAMYPDGAWEYHSGKELIKNDAEGREKKLRIFINANENDNGSTAAESGKHNWLMANQRTAAALKAKGFHYKYIEGKGQGHCAGTVKSATMASVLMWLWRGYVPSGT